MTERDNKPRRILCGIKDLQYYAGLARYAREHNWLMRTDLDWGKPPRFLSADGMISEFQGSVPMFEFIMRTGIRTVNLGAANTKIHGEPEHIFCYEVDYDAASEMVIRHFMDRGFNNFAWYHRSEHAIVLNRRDAFASQVRRQGKEFFSLQAGPHVPVAEQTDEVWDNYTQQVTEQIKSLPKPLALWVGHDCFIRFIQECCRIAGLNVPQDVAIMGMNNLRDICEELPIPASSVEIGKEQMGYEAADLLNGILDGREPPSPAPRHKPIGIVQRQSTDVVVVPNKDVADAMRYIHNNVANHVRVKDIVANSSLSRRMLDMLFKKYLGRPVSGELERLRLERAKRLLELSDDSIADVSEQAGYTSSINMYRAFIRNENRTPKDYRKKHRKKILMAWDPSDSFQENQYRSAAANG